MTTLTCVQCKSPVRIASKPPGVVLEGLYLLVGSLCCNKCIDHYISRSLLSNRRGLIARCDYSREHPKYDVVYEHRTIVPQRADPACWDTNHCFSAECEVCNGHVSVPVYKTKVGRYFWPGTTVQYTPGLDHPKIKFVDVVCSEKCYMSEWVSQVLSKRVVYKTYRKLPNGVWYAEQPGRSTANCR